jgi:hypothetical protein
MKCGLRSQIASNLLRIQSGRDLQPHEVELHSWIVAGGEKRIASLFDSDNVLRLSAALSVTYKYLLHHDMALPDLTLREYLRDVRLRSSVLRFRPSINLMLFLFTRLSGAFWHGYG